MSLFFSVLLFGIFLVSHQGPLKLSDKDFKSELSARGQLFTLFYAEWCGHCKKLHPTWNELSDNPEVNKYVAVAKVECSGDGKETCQDFEVRGYPTIKFVKIDSSGKQTTEDYNGARTAESLEAFALLHSRPAYTELDDEQLKQFMTPSSTVSVIAFVSGVDTELFKEFEKAAGSLKSTVRFGYTLSRDAAQSYGFEEDTVVLIRQSFLKTNLEESVVSTKESSNLEGFLLKNRYGLVGLRTSENEEEFVKPNVAIFFDFDPNLQSSLLRLVRNRMIPLAKEFPSLSFSVSRVEDYKRILEGMFSVKEKGIFVIIYNERGQRYPYFGELSVAAVNEFQEKLKNFVSEYVAGKLLRPYIRSQKAPASDPGPVKVVVGGTFEEIVFDETKDVLIKMYAPWCGHCKKLEPIYQKLAEALKNEDRLVIAEMDATENDAPEAYSVNGYPTIFFSKIGQKNSPVVYNENREVPDMIEWLRKHTTYPLSISKKDVEDL